ncbi:MAG TPA: PrsW family glutamic-type intramembrane protease [Pyrinomonadaceae bacterium]|nr:PrsW family glutamic-type intramembrane protease [Pyrinomonadaceae bacterium]
MKLKITIQNGSLAGRTAELEQPPQQQGAFLTFGRDANCSVRFDAGERVVSSKHAFVEAKPDGFYLTDNNSTNGTYVNGSRIQYQKLNSGDLITFGRDGIAVKVFIEAAAGAAQATLAFQNQIQPEEAGFQPPPVMTPVYQNQTSSPTVAAVANWRESMTRIGVRPPEIQPAQSQTGKKVLIGITIFIVVFLSLIVTAMITSSLGVAAAFVAAVVAFVPACIYILPLIWLDRYDPEPLWLLALAFAWGALVAVIFSATINDLMGAYFGRDVAAVISAPIFEEGSKGFGLVLLLLFFRHEFDDILDGIVFGGTIALGFATVENVLYYGRALVEGGFEMLAFLFFVRGILSPFAHVTFTAMTGIGCGIARESHNTFVRIFLPLLGYGCAVLLHAIWNGTPTLFGFEGFWYGYLFLQVPFFLIFMCFAGLIMFRQNMIMKEMLTIEVMRGLITQEQYKRATSAFRSSAWLIGAIGTDKYRARKRFLRAVGKLGLTYWHIQRATAAQGQTASFQQNPVLREEVLKWRDKV